MGCWLAFLFGIFAGGVLPSYILANAEPHPAWRRVAAALATPAFLALFALSMPTYPPGENLDDWRRGTLFGLSLVTGAISVTVQGALVLFRLLRRRK
ncbi:MAG TPA: hypothetical protein VGF28_00875 [Thermoanaerobaculia bacterium]|jgi:hypothetical protein